MGHAEFAGIDQSLLRCALDRYLSVALPHEVTPQLTYAIARHIDRAEVVAELILLHAMRIGLVQRYPALAKDLLDIVLQHSPQHFETLLAYSGFLRQERDYAAGIQASQQAVAVAQSSA